MMRPVQADLPLYKKIYIQENVSRYKVLIL